jgi:hypothetical protein
MLFLQNARSDTYENIINKNVLKVYPHECLKQKGLHYLCLMAQMRVVLFQSLDCTLLTNLSLKLNIRRE